MSARKIPSDAEADGDACWACLLAHLLRQISLCVSSVEISLSPSCPAHRHTSALARLLDRFLLALPRQQQNEKPKEQEVAPCRVFPSSLVQLDIFQVLLFSTNKLIALLSTVAQICGDEAHEYSAYNTGTREEVGLLDEREVFLREPEGCLERLLASFQRESPQSVKKETMNGMEIDGKELSKRFLEALSDLQECSDHLGLSLQKVSMELSSTVAHMTSKLTSSHHLAICSTTAYWRMLMRSFLYAHQEESDAKPKNSHPFFQHGYERLNRKADVVLEQLLNPQGPLIVGLGGSRGLGKTSIASYVACDERISAKFPGGVIYLRVGREPDLTSLQSQLWKQMWGGSICYSTCKATFSNPDEGTAALKSRAQEWLPCLLVLDDVWDAAHVQPFLCLDSNDRGRILVVSSTVESVLSNWKCDVFVLVLEPLDEEEASCLFKSIAECQDSGNAAPMAALIRNCAGNSRLIEAAASIVYYEKASAFTIPSVLSYIKQEARLPNAKMVTLEAAREGPDVDEGGENFKQQDLSMSSNCQDHIVFFDVLAEVHPCLQECFLDLAAFPKGQWVSFLAVLDVWSFGNRTEKERALLVLCFLASRSLVEWKVEESVDNDFDEGLSFHWRLADNFYELAQALIESKVKKGMESSAANNKEVNISFGELEEDLHGRARDVKRILGLLQRGVEALDTSEWLNTKQNIPPVFCLHQRRSKRLLDVFLKFNSGGSAFPSSTSSSIYFQKNCRFYFPCWQRDQHTAWWNKGEFSNKATKLSLISSDLTDFPAELDFSKLKVLLLSNNVKLKIIPESRLNCMEHLVVLDLKHCASLTLLPNSICGLHSLEVLELFSCTQLLSLPQAIGKLKSLKYFCLSGCLCLTCLPISMGSLINLVMLDLSSCSRLRSLPKTLGNLSSLQMLNLSGCYSLQYLPASIASLRKLHRLIISGCSNLSYTPPAFEQLMNMVRGTGGGAMAVPSQLWKLSQLEVLYLCSLKNLICLPPAVGKLQHLRHLNLSSCRSLEYLPEDIGSLFLLEKLDLSHTAIRKLPTTLGQLTSLVRLCLRGCSRLLCIPPSLCGLSRLECLEMAECWDFVMLPTEFGNAHAMPKLTELDLLGCSIKSLPCFDEGALPALQRLCLSSCQNLSSLPETFGNLTSLERVELEGCKSLASLHNIGIGNLKQLQWINIRNCLSLSNLPVSELIGLQSLKFFDVSGCTKLSPFPEPLLQCAREHRLTLIRWGTVWE